ncbi:GTP cyclohydrolase II [Oceanispirochaeta crateris]|nr:GTP cyclohydrolase II [Oceanispirochaeta crateris]
MNKRRLTVEQAIKIIAAGGMIIMTDDEDRENEGDLVCAARFADPNLVNFMASKAKGLICCALEKSLCKRAGLIPLDTNDGPGALHNTKFCTPVDAIEGCTTGISAFDRSTTLKRLASLDCQPGDFARPGHLLPIMEAEGGLDSRQGHTEATVELCRQAGLEGAAVICEIMDDDGRMARWDTLLEMAAEWDLGILTIEDLISWKEKQHPEISLEPVRLPTERGRFYMEFLNPAKGDKSTGGEHICLVCQNKSASSHPDGPLVRIHSECLTGDLFASSRCDCGRQLALSQELISRESEGYLIYLRQEGRGIGIKAKAAAYHLQDAGLDTLDANLKLGFKVDSRSYKTAANYLKEKGLTRIRLLTNNPDKISQLEEEGFQVTRVALLIEAGEENHKYINTKQKRMGHLST